MDEETCKESLRPVKNDLKRLKMDTSSMGREEKLAHLKETLSSIGSRIEVVAGFEKTSIAKEKKRKHLCKSIYLFRSYAYILPYLVSFLLGKWASYFWSTKVTSGQLRAM